MAKVRFIGNAINRKQVDTYTIASPSSGLSVYTIICNGKTFSYTAASAVAATEATALMTAFNEQTNILELLDAIADDNSASITFTARDEGVPFTFTYGVTGGGTFNGSTTTTNSGKSVFDLADNWSATINVADDLILDKPDTDIFYRLDQLTTALTSFTIDMAFNGQLGLPFQNQADYYEYRATYCKLNCPLVIIGTGTGQGPSRAYIWTNAGAATAVYVYNTGASLDDYPVVMLKHTSGGSNSFSVVRVVEGSVGIALLADETSTVTLLQVGDDNTNPSVRCGTGCTVAGLTISSGTVDMVNSPTGTTNITGGATVTINKGGAATLMEVIDGTLSLGGAGNFTITNLTVGENGVLDLSYGYGTVTVTNAIKVYKGFTIIDPLNRLASSTQFAPQQCNFLTDGTYTAPPSLTWTKS